jgi:crossover junction endodeoxyribonuclease RusA
MGPTGSFWVGGVPVTQGSSVIRYTKERRPFIAPDNSAPLKRWRNTVATVAGTSLSRRFAKHVPVWVRLTFYVIPPASAAHRPYPSTRSSGDVDKLARAVLDALTGVAFEDDSQVVHLTASLNYRPEGAGVRIGVGPMLDELDLPTEGTP